MAQIFYMPMRGERTAPIFDSNRARDLPKAFTEVERLFRRANITDDNEKKKQVVYYTDIDTEQIWQYIPEFDEPTSTYADFKDAIMEFYPEAAEFLYAITDIDSLTDERQRLGMTTVQDLSDYHLQFMAITTWLIKKGQLCELGQKRAYIRAFPAQLLPTIITRLQCTFPKHHPAIPYPVTEVYNTAKSILQGIPFLGFTSQVQPIMAPVLPPEKPIITEIFAPLIAEIKKTIIETVKTAHTPARDNQIAITEVADIQPIFSRFSPSLIQLASSRILLIQPKKNLSHQNQSKYIATLTVLPKNHIQSLTNLFLRRPILRQINYNQMLLIPNRNRRQYQFRTSG